MRRPGGASSPASSGRKNRAHSSRCDRIAHPFDCAVACPRRLRRPSSPLPRGIALYTIRITADHRPAATFEPACSTSVLFRASPKQNSRGSALGEKNNVFIFAPRGRQEPEPISAIPPALKYNHLPYSAATVRMGYVRIRPFEGELRRLQIAEKEPIATRCGCRGEVPLGIDARLGQSDSVHFSNGVDLRDEKLTQSSEIEGPHNLLLPSLSFLLLLAATLWRLDAEPQ